MVFFLSVSMLTPSKKGTATIRLILTPVPAPCKERANEWALRPERPAAAAGVEVATVFASLCLMGSPPPANSADFPLISL